MPVQLCYDTPDGGASVCMLRPKALMWYQLGVCVAWLIVHQGCSMAESSVESEMHLNDE